MFPLYTNDGFPAFLPSRVPGFSSVTGSDSQFNRHVLSICLLILIATVISFYVFGILFLVQDYETCKECEDSLLWTYVLITLILALCNGGSTKGKGKDAKQLFCVYMVV